PGASIVEPGMKPEQNRDKAVVGEQLGVITRKNQRQDDMAILGKPVKKNAESRLELAPALKEKDAGVALRESEAIDGTLVLKVDRLEDGIAEVKGAAREQGGVAFTVRNRDGRPAENSVGLQAEIPVDKVQAMTTRLKASNTVIEFYAAPYGAQYSRGLQTN